CRGSGSVPDALRVSADQFDPQNEDQIGGRSGTRERLSSSKGAECAQNRPANELGAGSAEPEGVGNEARPQARGVRWGRRCQSTRMGAGRHSGVCGGQSGGAGGSVGVGDPEVGGGAEAGVSRAPRKNTTAPTTATVV